MGPLQGVRVVELAGIGPGPFCAMLLADLGAEVLAVDRPAAGQPGWPALFGRGRRRVAVDLKHPDGPGVVLDLVAGADALVEGFRGDIHVWLRIGEKGVIERCRLRDPSWFQWPLLEAAIEGNIVADFPLCNKSFNCSYSGHDL